MKLLLLSGGMDSSALAAMLMPERALSIDYGQLAADAELEAAQLVATHYAITLDVVRIDARSLGSGTMTGQRPLESDPCPEWWPYRNQFLLTIAAMHAYKCGASELIIGAVVTDGEAHTDGRPEFFKRMSHLLGYQEGGIAISTPAITLTTVALVKQAGIPISVLAGTHSCHVSNLACGRCRGCLKREAVIYELGYIEV